MSRGCSARPLRVTMAAPLVGSSEGSLEHGRAVQSGLDEGPCAATVEPQPLAYELPTGDELPRSGQDRRRGPFFTR